MSKPSIPPEIPFPYLRVGRWLSGQDEEPLEYTTRQKRHQMEPGQAMVGLPGKTEGSWTAHLCNIYMEEELYDVVLELDAAYQK